MFGVISLPDFALQAALRHQPACSRHEPVAILGGDTAAKPGIIQCNASALATGVQAGMTSSQALGRCGHLRLLCRSPMQETAAALALLESAFSCSPWVEATGEGVCTFELRHPRPTDEDLAGRVIDHLARLDLQARVGFAANPDLALLAAHAARPVLVVHDSHAFLVDLPITALNPGPRPLSILQKWGIATVGAFGALPAQEVSRRLGSEGHSLWLRATGRQHRLLRLTSLPESYQESMEFEYEVQTLEPLLFVLRRFLDQLVLRLEAIYRVPAALNLQLRFDDGREYQRHFAIPAPTNNVESLFRVVHTHLESFTATAPIRSVQLAATPAVASREQFGLFETTMRDPLGFSETVARLHALLGNDRAGVACLEIGHRPDAFHVEAPDFLHLTDGPESDGKISKDLPAFGLPLRRLRPPLVLQVKISRHVPVHVHSALAAGAVRAARGPFQLLGGWWEPPAWACEEWDIELAQGGLYRVSRHDGNWFLEGVYD